MHNKQRFKHTMSIRNQNLGCGYVDDSMVSNRSVTKAAPPVTLASIANHSQHPSGKILMNKKTRGLVGWLAWRQKTQTNSGCTTTVYHYLFTVYSQMRAQFTGRHLLVLVCKHGALYS